MRFDFGHNYNRTSREAVYGWFNKWLQHGASYEPIPEKSYQKEPDSDLRVFPDNRLPAGAGFGGTAVPFSTATWAAARSMMTTVPALG